MIPAPLGSAVVSGALARDRVGRQALVRAAVLTALGRAGVDPTGHDPGLVGVAGGRGEPLQVELRGGLASAAQGLDVHVSLTHEGAVSAAFAVVSRAD